MAQPHIQHEKQGQNLNLNQHEQHKTSSTGDIKSKRVSLLQWNTLADYLSEAFPQVDKSCLAWEHRSCLFEQILSSKQDVDIICLEEVDKPEFFSNLLQKFGYSTSFNKKPNADQLDGILVAYKTDRFKLASTIENKRYQNITHKFSQVYTCLQLIDSLSKQTFLIYATHLKAKHEYEQVRVEEVTMLLDDLQQRFKQSQTQTNTNALTQTNVLTQTNTETQQCLQQATKPIVFILGDMNTEPDSESIKLFSQFEPVRLQSAFEGVPMTTFKMRDKQYCRVIDYIWFERERLKLVQNDKLLTKEEIGNKGLPTKYFPSDHLYLKSVFEIIQDKCDVI